MHNRKHQISNPVEPSSPATPATRPDPEVVPTAKRRTFSNAEKLRILAAADACQARAHCATFFTWYNRQHRHSGIGMTTPESVHTGRAAEIRKLRQATLESAYKRTPGRFKHRVPRQAKLPTAAWINPPATEKKAV
ncbi:integrase core domain-containing protein [Massilia jejuensis]|uniref:Integrase core domain-containing protein n=1 Tax=Massilia jejuensis TaxID=648894 RepID=A0ABW0PL44_9BURK